MSDLPVRIVADMDIFRATLVAPNTTLVDVIRCINDSALQIAFVIGENTRLLGTITDGDIRRAILAGLSLESTPARQVMNPSPHVGWEDTSPEEANRIMRMHNVHCLPLVTSTKSLIGFYIEKSFLPSSLYQPCSDLDAVLMVGGKGTRLRPYTETLPKPMLPVRGRPMLEHIMDRLISYGFRRFWFAVHYKADVIKKHFGDGSRFDCHISYIHEERPLGTAGALSLLPQDALSQRFLVMNGDVLTDIDFAALSVFHERMHATATMCISRHEMEIPFGVVQTKDMYLESIEEKPSINFFVNAGIYLLEKGALSHIPHNEYFDMPMLLAKLKEKGEKVATFPLHEEWKDVGTIKVYESCR